MLRSKENLAGVLAKKLSTGGALAQQCLERASEVVVFGSVSAGVDRPDSDIDILCIGGSSCKIKTKMLDLIVVPTDVLESRIWLTGELASHVIDYGTWIKGTPRWRKRVSVGTEAIIGKRRRVSAFMRSLSNSWFRLQECYRVKYSVKIRRETQRLILLEQTIPVPPTSLLDNSWSEFSKSPNHVYECLRDLQVKVNGDFMDDLLSRIHNQFKGNTRVS